ncbi:MULTISPECIES: helix-turn-helix domain-containing protein [unclassified Oscillibacter]|jgi:hypothetical protein|uniref:helix-turn-helix domain-containing protein n=1 Tax=Oscillospiraceae TaxID=216572 RepID=UPI0003ADA6D8|nr:MULTISPECIES: helix-turn-helix domain-containing protein [unclassified Oscillibacter]ERK63045.1 bacteriophage CI repressor protein [Oscillibacter sp. KLE 1745]ERK65115.1 bacteriophage CI repressor protein [Oscillibacter sp. KLE 1728]
MDAVDRIFELVGEKFKEQKEFASALRVNDKTVSAWRTRRAKSYTKYLPQIAEALGTTTEYLLTGEGPQKRGPRPVVSDSDTVSEDTIKAAFFEGGQDLTPAEMDELWEDAKDYIQYKLDQRRRKKK